MTLGDRVAVLRKGDAPAGARRPRELYEQPVNLFVAGFIGSPPMNFLPATVRGRHAGDAVRRPIELDERGGRAVAGPGPGARRASGRSTSRTPPWSTRRKRAARRRRSAPRSTSPSGSATRSTPTSPSRPRSRSPTSCGSCPASSTARSCAPRPIVSIDATSRIREGREAEFWFDSPQGARVRPGVRGEPDPGRRGRRRADPAGDGGPGRAGGGAARASTAQPTGPGVSLRPAALVARRGRLPGLPALVRRLRRRRRRGPAGDHARACPTSPSWASTPSGSRRSTRRRRPTRATTSPTTATSTRGSARSPTPTRCIARGARARPAGASSTWSRTTPPTSTPWFRAALAAGPGQPRAGPVPVPRRPRPDGELPPNNWAASSAARRGPG